MQTLIYEYNHKQIEFLLSGDMLVNATEMAAVHNKRAVDFTRRPETISFVEKLSKRPIGENKGVDFTPFLSGFKDLDPEKVIKSVNGVPILITIPGREGATWMHRWLAIDFAMYLDLDFKIWIIEKIDYLLVNFSNKHRELINQEQELIKEKQKLLNKHSDNPAIFRLNQIHDSLKSISKRKGVVTRRQYDIWNNELNN